MSLRVRSGSNAAVRGRRPYHGSARLGSPRRDREGIVAACAMLSGRRASPHRGGLAMRLPPSRPAALDRGSALAFALALCGASIGCGRLYFEGREAPDAAPPSDAATNDASLRDTGTIDLGACVPTAEICDGLDNDCNGARDDLPVAQCPAVARDRSFTIAGVTFDQADAVTNASVTEGAIEANSYAAAFGQSLTGFDDARSLGSLLGLSTQATRSFHVIFPEQNGSAPEPNQVRTTVTTDWGGATALAGEGPDIAVYEIESQEPFAVSLRFDDGTFSAARYVRPAQRDATQDAWVTLVETDDFGAAGRAVTAVRIHNVWNDQAAGGADLVNDPSGEGHLLRAADPDYANGHPLLIEGGISPGTLALDADPIWVVALRPLRASECCPGG